MYEDYPTVELDKVGPPDDQEDEQVEEIVDKLPKPLVLRAVAFAAANVAAAAAGKQFDISPWIDQALGLYMVAAPVVVGVWLRFKTKKPKRAGKHRAA